MTGPDAGTTTGTVRTAVSIFDILRRHAGAVALCFVLAGIGCLGYRALLKPAATATASVVVENPRLDASGLGASDPVRYFDSQLALARLPVVARNAIAAIPGGAASLNPDEIEVTADQVSDTVVITAALPQGQDDAAVRFADGVLKSYIAISTNARKIQAQQSLGVVDATLDTLRLDNSTAAVTLRTQLTNRQVALRSEAVGPVSLLIPSAAQLQPAGRPGVTRVGLVFLLGGLWAGVAVAIGRDGAGRLLTHAEDASRIAGLPILATLTLQRRGLQRAEAVWETVLPDDGPLNVLPLAGAFQLGRLDPAARQARRLTTLLGRYATSIRVVDAALRADDLELLTRGDPRLVIIAGPRSRESALLEVMAEVSRINVQPAGLIWSHPEPLAPRLRRAGAGRPAGSALRRPVRRPSLASASAGEPR